jgi:hypothetical protein
MQVQLTGSQLETVVGLIVLGGVWGLMLLKRIADQLTATHIRTNIDLVDISNRLLNIEQHLIEIETNSPRADDTGYGLNDIKDVLSEISTKLNPDEPKTGVGAVEVDLSILNDHFSRFVTATAAFQDSLTLVVEKISFTLDGAVRDLRGWSALDLIAQDLSAIADHYRPFVDD